MFKELTFYIPSINPKVLFLEIPKFSSFRIF